MYCIVILYRDFNSMLYFIDFVIKYDYLILLKFNYFLFKRVFIKFFLRFKVGRKR